MIGPVAPSVNTEAGGREAAQASFLRQILHQPAPHAMDLVRADNWNSPTGETAILPPAQGFGGQDGPWANTGPWSITGPDGTCQSGQPRPESYPHRRAATCPSPVDKLPRIALIIRQTSDANPCQAFRHLGLTISAASSAAGRRNNMTAKEKAAGRQWKAETFTSKCAAKIRKNAKSARYLAFY